MKRIATVGGAKIHPDLMKELRRVGYYQVDILSAAPKNLSGDQLLNAISRELLGLGDLNGTIVYCGGDPRFWVIAVMAMRVLRQFEEPLTLFPVQGGKRGSYRLTRGEQVVPLP